VANKIPDDFQAGDMHRFLELGVRYLELKLLILKNVPAEINLCPWYYTKIFHKT